MICVTADDFGLSLEGDTAICSLIEKGIVSRVSLMAGGDTFTSATKTLKRKKDVEVYAHLNLTDGVPCAAKERIASLLDRKGQFLGGRHLRVLMSISSGRFVMGEIEEEWSAQIEKIQAEGLVVGGINSHGHLHLFPLLQGLTLKIMKRFNIKELRLHSGFEGGVKGFIFRCLSEQTKKRAQRQGLPLGEKERLIGLDCHGHFFGNKAMQALRSAAAGEKCEVIIHPATSNGRYQKEWGYEAKQEYDTWSGENMRKMLEKKRA